MIRPDKVEEILNDPYNDFCCISYMEDGNVLLLQDMYASLSMEQYLALLLYGKDTPYYRLEQVWDMYKIVVKKGLVYDLASVTKRISGLNIGLPFLARDTFPEASTVHDALYSYMLTMPFSKQEKYRALADDILKRHLKTQQPRIPKFLQKTIFMGVRFGYWVVRGMKSMSFLVVVLILSACALYKADNWRIDGAIYEVYHLRIEEPSLDVSKALLSRGVNAEELPRAIERLNNIKHVGQ